MGGFLVHYLRRCYLTTASHPRSFDGELLICFIREWSASPSGTPTSCPDRLLTSVATMHSTHVCAYWIRNREWWLSGFAFGMSSICFLDRTVCPVHHSLHCPASYRTSLSTTVAHPSGDLVPFRSRMEPPRPMNEGWQREWGQPSRMAIGWFRQLLP